MKRLHGKHNKDVCDVLHLKSALECNDWVITTAFYSAIHYFDHLLFPYLHKDGTTFNDINEAHRIINQVNKHETRGILIQTKIPAKGGDYTFLKEECYNARYGNWMVNDIIAKKAVSKLEAIIEMSNELFTKEEKNKKK